jgi:GGDEF domain-containing protein
MTVSIGVVELPADASMDLPTALAAADRAMYQSKRQAATCVAIAGGLLDPELVLERRVR